MLALEEVDLVLDLLALGRLVVGDVVAADADHRDAIAIPAPQPPQGLAEGLPDGVPDRRIDAGHRLHRVPARPKLVEGRREHRLPDAFRGKGIEADDARHQLVER